MRTSNATRSHQGLETPLLELELLRAFAEVCTHGSITAAALKLHRSQSAISQQIGKLERKAGIALLVRNATGVQPTAEGLTLLEHARDMLAHNERVFQRLAPGRIVGRVRVGATDQYANEVLPPMLRRFLEGHRDVQVEVHAGVASSLQSRLGDDLDLIITLREQQRDPLPPSETVLGHVAVDWVCARGSRVFQDDPLPIVVFAEGSLFRRWMIVHLQAQRRAFRVAYSTSSVAGVEHAVAAGLGVSVLKHDTVSARLRRLRPSDGFPSLPDVDVVMSTPAGPLSPSVRALRSFLQEHLSQAIGSKAVR